MCARINDVSRIWANWPICLAYGSVGRYARGIPAHIGQLADMHVRIQASWPICAWSLCAYRPVGRYAAHMGQLADMPFMWFWLKCSAGSPMHIQGVAFFKQEACHATHGQEATCIFCTRRSLRKSISKKQKTRVRIRHKPLLLQSTDTDASKCGGR